MTWCTPAAVVAAVLLATHVAAADDIPGDASTTATISLRAESTTRDVLDPAGDADWYRVGLVRGRDYAARILPTPDTGDASVTVRDPGGRPIRTAGSFNGTDSGFELRAATTGTHFVEVRDLRAPGAAGPLGYAIDITPDCRDAASTRCALRIGRPYNGRSLFLADHDRFALTLDRSRRYTFALTDPTEQGELVLEVLDGRGRLVRRAFASGGPVVIRRFRPATSGRHHLRVAVGFDTGGRYSLLATAD